MNLFIHNFDIIIPPTEITTTVEGATKELSEHTRGAWISLIAVIVILVIAIVLIVLKTICNNRKVR